MSQHRRRALIIDDEPDLTRYLGMLLEDNGWQVRTANSANQGLDLAHEQVPDVILLDVMMPERGGLSTLVALRKDPELGGVPVVFVTAVEGHLHNIYDPDREHQFSRHLGRFKRFHADAVIDKPVDPERLFAVLDELTQSN